MLHYDVLDEIAEQIIPNDIHPELHVNPRQAWITLMVEILEYKSIDFDYTTLYRYAKDWEVLLYKRYSIVN